MEVQRSLLLNRLICLCREVSTKTYKMEPSAPLIDNLWEIADAGFRQMNLAKKVDKDLNSLIAPSFKELDRLEKESLKFSEVQLYLAIKRYKIKVTELKGDFKENSINESGLDLGRVSELYKINNPRLIFFEEKVKRLSEFLLWWKIFHEKYLAMVENDSFVRSREYHETRMRPNFIKKFKEAGLKFISFDNFSHLEICLNVEIFETKCEIDLFSSKIVKFFDIQGDTLFEIYKKAFRKLVGLIKENRLKDIKPQFGEYGLYLVKSDIENGESLEKIFYDHIKDAVPII